PCTWILREPGIGQVTASDSCEVFWMRELGTAFIGIVLLGSRTRCVRQGSRAAGCGPGRSEGARQADCGPRTRQCNAADPAKLPYAGVNRIRFEGTVSTARPKATRYPRFCGLLNHSARRDAGPRRRPPPGGAARLPGGPRHGAGMVFRISFLLIALLAGAAGLIPGRFGAVVDSLLSGMLANTGWLYLLVVFATLVFMVYLAFGS